MFHRKGPTFFELAQQALSSTERGYDLLAPKFDYTPFRTPDFVLQDVAAQLQPQAPFGSALDICCGTGAGLQMLRPLVAGRLAGIDMSAGMLEVCREKLAAFPGQAELELVRGDALDMPFENEFDLAVSFGANGHVLVKDGPAFVDQIAKVLKPGGKFVFLTGYRPSLVSPVYWLARGFNFAMHVRNLLIRPHFVMFYLTFMLPEVRQLFETRGFEIDEREGVFGPRLHRLRLVIATLRDTVESEDEEQTPEK